MLCNFPTIKDYMNTITLTPEQLPEPNFDGKRILYRSDDIVLYTQVNLNGHLLIREAEELHFDQDTQQWEGLPITPAEALEAFPKSTVLNPFTQKLAALVIA